MAVRVLVLACMGLLGACSDSSSPTTDAAMKDTGPRPDGQVNPDVKSMDGKPRESSTGDKGQPDAKQPAHWTSVPGPSVGMVGHSATLLPNGDVLIVGGYTYDSVKADYVILKTAYRYIAATGKLTTAGELKEARYNHTATLLKNGKVLVVGGEYDDYYPLKTVEIFDPVTMTWSQGTSLFQALTSHADCLLTNGMVLITGGYTHTDSGDSMTLYDPTSGSWKTPPSLLKDKRRSHTMTLLKSGNVLIAGGITGTSMWKYQSMVSTELFDPMSGALTKGPDMTRPRSDHTATLRSDGTVLLVGGMYWENRSNPPTYKAVNNLYDPVKNTMSDVSYPVSSLPTGHGSVLMKNGNVLVVDQDLVLAYSPQMGGTWDSLPAMPDQRWNITATHLNNDTVLVAGGMIGSAFPYTYPTTLSIFHP